MRRSRVILAAIALALVVPGTVTAHGGHHHSPFASPGSRIHGHSQSRLITQWARWVFGSPAETSEAINGICAPSPHDPKVWFLPVSTAPEDVSVSCTVPEGAYLLLSPGGFECSEAEGNGTTRAELRACAKAGFAEIVAAEVTLDGRSYTKLDRYIKTTPRYHLPGPNLLGPDPTPSLMKGYFLFVKPLRRGHHTASGSVTFSDGWTGVVSYDITVVRKHHH